MNASASPAVFESELVASIGYDALLALLGERDRATLERHISVYEQKLGAVRAERWRSLARALLTLAPIRPKLCGANAMQFYIPDGKYRKQVFALQALADGAFAVYAPDVLAEAIRAGLLSRITSTGAGTLYYLVPSKDILIIDAVDPRAVDPDTFYKDLVGWNRKAIRITLPAQASEAQVRATRRLCGLAATQWTQITPE